MKTVLLVLAATLALCAQTPSTITVHFATPVVVGETSMPAGDCTLQVRHDAGDSLTLTVRSAAGPAATVLVNRIVDETTDSIYNPHIVLRRTGSAYHFQKLLLADGTGFEIL